MFLQRRVLQQSPTAVVRYPRKLASDQPARSPADADFFLAWIDRLIEMASRHDGYNTPDEKTAVLKPLADARSVFLERAAR